MDWNSDGPRDRRTKIQSRLRGREAEREVSGTSGEAHAFPWETGIPGNLFKLNTKSTKQMTM